MNSEYKEPVRLPSPFFSQRLIGRVFLFFWIAIAVVSYLQDVGATVLLIGTSNNYLYTIVVTFGTLLWIPFTHVVMRLQRRFPFTRHRPLFFFWIHGVLALVITMLHFISEAAVIEMFLSVVYGKHLSLTLPGPAAFLMSFNTRIIIYFSIVGVCEGLHYFNQLQQEKSRTSDLQYQLITAQLQSLKMQIQPHFLFNTHNSIISLIVKKENDKAAEMLMQLSDLLRLTLEKGDQQTTTLNEEVAFIQKYLDIQKVRFNDRLQVHYDISSHACDAMVPGFVLQPLVENSIIHGIAPLTDARTINIRADIQNDKLILEVRDDGIGLPSNFIEGIGIKNVRGRLNKLYDDNFLFTMSGHHTKGTISKIVIPYSAAI